MSPLTIQQIRNHRTPFEQMRDAIQARCIKRGTDWEYLSESDRRVLSATALEAGDDEWLNETGELREYIVNILNHGNPFAADDLDVKLSMAAIQIAHHSGKYLYEDTWPRMDPNDFTDDSNAGKRLNEGDL